MFLSIHILTTLLLAILKIVCLLVAIAYFTLAERKIMAAVQRRVGPNVVGLIGLLQPLADGLKLAGKEAVVPSQASGRIFMAAAIAVLLFALSGWSTIPFGLFDHSEHMRSSNVVYSLYEHTRWYQVRNVDSLFSYDARYGRRLHDAVVEMGHWSAEAAGEITYDTEKETLLSCFGGGCSF